MKKALAFLISLVTMFICFNAIADGEHSEPILFRGVEWGSTYKEVVKALPDGVKMYDLKIAEYWYPMSDNMYDGSGWGNQFKAEIGGYSYASSSSLKGVRVAGYNVEGIYLYFLFNPDDNGTLVRDEDHTAFFYGYYKLEPKDPDAVFNDLVAKLTSLYGDVDEEKSDTGIIDDKMCLWYGADGTMVSVYRQDYSSGTHEIYIKYGFVGGDELMEKAYEAAVREESDAAASNIDGL